MTAKRDKLIKEGNKTVQFIYASLRALPRPSIAMNVLCAVQAMMCVSYRDHDRELDESQIRAMMGEMTNNVVRLILGENDGASARAGEIPEEVALRRDN